ncbi:MAG: hypothetical protein J4F46_04205 [Dehalococcoidia bacterium]|nr:hypothetical protein [Dehalococcoidia bacterium]
MPHDYSITIGTTGRGTWNSGDGGDSWRRIERIFGEVICVAWQPNSEDVQLKQTSSGTYAGFGGKVHTQDTLEAHGLSR